jgi:hypothetical protein
VGSTNRTVTKYEIHVNLCENVELHDIVMTCLSRLVGDQDVCWPTSYQQVPHTLSMTLQSTWKQLVEDYEAAHGGPAATIDEFHVCWALKPPAKSLPAAINSKHPPVPIQAQ